MESLVATSPMKMAANGEELVITMANPNHGNGSHQGHCFSRELLARPTPSATPGNSWYGRRTGAHCDPSSVVMTAPPVMMTTTPYPTYPYSHGQMMQQHVHPEIPRPVLNTHRSAFSPPREGVSLTSVERMKRPRSKSFDISEPCLVNQGLEHEDSSMESPLPEKQKCNERWNRIYFSGDSLGKYYRRFSSRQKKKTSFYGVTADSGDEMQRGSDDLGCRVRRSRSASVVKTETVRINGGAVEYNSEGGRGSSRTPSVTGSVEYSNNNGHVIYTPANGRSLSTPANGCSASTPANGCSANTPASGRSANTPASGRSANGCSTSTPRCSPEDDTASALADKKDLLSGSCEVSVSLLYAGEMKKVFCINRLVWGKLPGYSWWPGCIVTYGNKDCEKDTKETKERTTTNKQQAKESPSLQEGSEVTSVWVKWFGENQLSLVTMDKLALIEEFGKYYSPAHMKGTYKKAIIAVLKEAAKRCAMTFSSDPNDRELRWVVVENSSRIVAANESPVVAASSDSGAITEMNGSAITKDNKNGDLQDEKSVMMEVDEDCEDPLKANSNSNNNSRSSSSVNADINQSIVKAARSAKKGKMNKELFLTSYEKELLEWALSGFLPHGPLGGLLPTESEQMANTKVIEGEKTVKVLVMSDSKKRNKGHFDMVRQGKLKMEDICISCGAREVVAVHPLFVGGLCEPCKNGFVECVYLYDDDGSQMYCTICSAGDEVFICDSESCGKVICQPCIERLCGAQEVERVRACSTWHCYLCSDAHSRVGLLTRRDDWDICLSELFKNDREMEFEPFPVYPPIAPELRKPIRVLSLFDGIATAHFVLNELGLEVEHYVSSEVDMDAVTVCCVQFPQAIRVGDIRYITEKEVRAWGPFDLVIGGSPCNDLSQVNPARKGIYGGTGKLFFEFFRILSIAKPEVGEDRPFFWLYENVTSMQREDKEVISRFLKCNPVILDAISVSAARRLRFFWGNIPGMTRPMVPLPSDRLTLQECLEPNCFRLAQRIKMPTITTRMNSVKPKDEFPVLVKGYEEKEDVIWGTEMERVFGLPPHYTDVNNLTRQGRQKLLGKSWSVPVIRHLLSPLKDYFMSSKTKKDIKDKKED